MIQYRLVETEAEFERLCHLIEPEPELAIDLEADSLHHYREKVCLIQLSTRKNSWIIDPFKIKNISRLAVITENSGCRIVLHGGDYDIRSLHRDFGIAVSNVFDTMIAAQFTGTSEFGLAALLRGYYGIELDKRFQKADWSKRPLPAVMMDYAAEDTAYLLQLSDQLRKELKENGRITWVEEECNLLTANRGHERGQGEPLFINCKGAGKLGRRNLAVLEQLLLLRDRYAQQMDRPPFKVMPTDALMLMAEKIPKNINEVMMTRGMTSKLAERYGSEIMAAINRGTNLPADRLPEYPRSKGEPNHGIKQIMAHLKSWREQFSSSIGLSPGLVAPNRLLEKIAETRPATVSDIAMIAGVRNWQISLWGNEVLGVLAKESQIK